MTRRYHILAVFLVVFIGSCTPERKAFVVKRQAILDSPQIAPEVKERVSTMGPAFLDTMLDRKNILKLDYILNNPDEPAKKQLKILDGYWWIGMTKEEALASFGKPYPVNTTVNPWGTHEQWVYRSSGYYLYFDNGLLTSFQH